MPTNPRIAIASRTVFAAGHEFGPAGAYEKLSGRAHFAVDPKEPAYGTIVDLDKAPRSAAGLVEFAADIMILKPVDPARGNRRLFFGYGNRGNKRELQFFNDAPPSNDPTTLAHAGNGFLFRRGYTIVWAAWEGDLLPGNGRLVLDVPVATENGQPITGPVRSEFIVEKPTTTLPLSGRASTRSYPAASLDTRQATLTRRRYQGDARIPIPADQWAFARVEGGSGLDNQGAEQAVVPSDINIHLPAGFQPGWIYELVYTGRDPRVHGLGHVVVRDLVSFLKRDAGAGNPLAGTVDKAYAWGRSQTGRCIRDFIHQGFNADADGRQVFEGVLPHVSGGGLMWMNHRFSLVVSPAGQQYEDHATMADRFPFSYAASVDPHTGATDAILKRPETDPLVLHTQSAIEYWQRRGSLVHTDAHGNDLPQPDGVRVYLWSSSQHFADPNIKRPARGICRNYLNIVQTSMLFRAMLDALDRWATDGTPPPESRIPRRADGTLVTAEEWRRRFPAIPGVALPTGANACPLLDFGPRARDGIIDQEPPVVLAAEGYPTLVPAVDADGNDIAGVRAPMVQAPLGTYTGWNIRDRGHGHGAMHEFTGSYIPFPDTDEERAATGDPRPSVRSRHATPADYAAAIEAAARALVADGLMLEEDVPRAVAAAADWGRPLHDVRL
ncbi:alpha/beta hydrolase domain-containing protein [Stella sp.]|uniref:alpha/beta hydrolase domain-containing protein n=1 Tax=Stella sp. TaxID=2912054 RepID=UPI0035B11A92